jgi:hypothetical protein
LLGRDSLIQQDNGDLCPQHGEEAQKRGCE